METAKHTPTPYKATHIGEGEFRKEIIVDVASCGQIAEVLDAGNGRANAELIVLACNAHDALVEALERYVDADTGVEEDDLLRTARAALRSAGVLPQDDDQRAPNGRRVGP